MTSELQPYGALGTLGILSTFRPQLPYNSILCCIIIMVNNNNNNNNNKALFHQRLIYKREYIKENKCKRKFKLRKTYWIPPYSERNVF